MAFISKYSWNMHSRFTVRDFIVSGGSDLLKNSLAGHDWSKPADYLISWHVGVFIFPLMGQNHISGVFSSMGVLLLRDIVYEVA